MARWRHQQVYASVFDLQAQKGGLLLLRPSAENPNKPRETRFPCQGSPACFSESEEWGRAHALLCGCGSQRYGALRRGPDADTRQRKRCTKKRFAFLADEIVSRKARAVVIAGPSSSGKNHECKPALCTASCARKNRLSLVSLDNYYLNRDQLKPGPDGKIDLEDIATLDIPQFSGGSDAAPARRRGGPARCSISSVKSAAIKGSASVSTRTRRSSSKACTVLNPMLLPKRRG